MKNMKIKNPKSTKALKIDLHIHTNRSFDSNITPEDAVKHAQKRGLDAIGITDHGTMKGSIDVLEFQKKNKIKKPLILIGQEINTKQGEIIIFNVKKDIRGNQDLLETCKQVKKLNGFIIVPHPFDFFRRGIKNHINDIVQYIDAVEVFNAGCFLSKFNKRAEEFANRHNIPGIAGSDAHMKEEIGKAFIVVNAKLNVTDIFNTIRNKKIKLVKNKINVCFYLKNKINKTFKKRRIKTNLIKK